jgi:predicted deacylase
VQTSPYDELAAAWKGLRRTHGVRVHEVACVGAPRTLLLVEIGMHTGPAVQLSAGVHGDEPAAPWAVHAAVRDRLLDERFTYRIWACLNPSGYAAGTRVNAEGADINRSFSRGGTTPEARALITANRDRRFALNIDLHEDPVAGGFYMYEPLAPGAEPYIAEAVIAAIEDAGLPVQDLADPAFDLGSPAEARAVQRVGHGTVVVDARAESPFFSSGLPLSLFLLRQACAAAVTCESPATRPWDVRIAAHRIALVTALERLSARSA